MIHIETKTTFEEKNQTRNSYFLIQKLLYLISISVKYIVVEYKVFKKKCDLVS